MNLRWKTQFPKTVLGKATCFSDSQQGVTSWGGGRNQRSLETRVDLKHRQY